jgi:putative PIG3 family NAD(P)H quinone oxidoreductase
MSEAPETMTCVAIAEPGGPEVLRPTRRPTPQPGPTQVLIAVAAAGVNRPDVSQRLGKYPPPAGAPDLPGLEVAGQVIARGPQARRYAVGDKVCALVAGGGYAQFCAADESNALPIPTPFSMIEAAAVPETFFTVWTNVFQRARLASGEWLLVHGGSSGIGTTAIMLAKAFGAKVAATAGSQQKCETCLQLGADVAINYRTQDFVEAVRAATEGRGADVILDMVGGDYVGRNIRCAALNGRIAQIAFMRGPKITADFGAITNKRLTWTGSTLRPRTVAEKAAIARELEERVWPLFEASRCKPLIDSTFPLERAADAHTRMESGDHRGKIVLVI